MFGSLFRKSSKLIEGCKIAYQQGGEKAVAQYIDALSPRDKKQLMNDVMNAEVDMIQQHIIASINKSIENTIPFLGFSEN